MSVIYLNTPAVGAKAALVNFNFKESLIDSIHGFTATLGGSATQGNSGVSIPSYNSRIILTEINFAIIGNIFTFEIDVGDCNINTSDGKHKRFFMWSSACGLIYRSTGYWGIYGNDWYMTTISDKDFFKNSTVKIACNKNNIKLYRNNQLVHEFNINSYLSSGNSYNLYIGSNDQSAHNMIIEGFRVY